MGFEQKEELSKYKIMNMPLSRQYGSGFVEMVKSIFFGQLLLSFIISLISILLLLIRFCRSRVIEVSDLIGRFQSAIILSNLLKLAIKLPSLEMETAVIFVVC